MIRLSMITKYGSVSILVKDMAEVMNKLKEYKSKGLIVLNYTYEKLSN